MDHYRNIDCVPPKPDRPLYNNVVGWKFSGEDPTEPVTLEEMKAHLKIGYDDEDDYITELIKQVRQSFEEVLWLSLIERTVTATIRNEIGNIELPFGPVTTFTDLKDKEDAVQDAANYDLSFGDFPKLETKYDFAKVTYNAGYTAGTMPSGLKNALIREVAWRYNHRGDEDNDSNGIHVQGAKTYKRGSWLL